MVLVLVVGADPAGSDASARDGAAAELEDGGAPPPTGEERKGSMTEKDQKTQDTRDETTRDYPRRNTRTLSREKILACKSCACATPQPGEGPSLLPRTLHPGRDRLKFRLLHIVYIYLLLTT